MRYLVKRIPSTSLVHYDGSRYFCEIAGGTAEKASVNTADLLSGSKYLDVQTGNWYVYDELSNSWALSQEGGSADPAVIEQAVTDWLDDHPEATTTVADGSITEAKLASALAQKVNQVTTLSDEIVQEEKEYLFPILEISAERGYYNTSTKEFVSQAAAMVTNPIECHAGDVFILPKNQTIYSWATLVTKNQNGDVLTCTNVSNSGNDLVYTCTDDDKFIIFGFRNNSPVNVQRVTGEKTVKYITAKNTEIIDGISQYVFANGTMLDISNIVAYSGYCGANGAISDYANAKCVSLPCAMGDKYIYTGTVYGLIKYYYLKDASGAVIDFDSYTGNAVNREIVITNPNASIIVFSFYVGNSATFSLKKVLPDYSMSRIDSKPYAGKTAFCFGDSITFGVNGGYTTYITDKTGLTIDNYGHSGDGIVNALYVATNGAFGTANSETKLCADYSGASIATIMIGTNGGVPANWQESLQNCPALKWEQGLPYLPFTRDGNTISTPAEYFAMFPSDAIGQYCFMLEWMMYQNQNMKIFLITPPVRNSLSINTQNIHDAVVAIGKRYGIPVIDTYENCMINLMNFNQYSSDGTHFLTNGNAVWGTYIGEYIAKYPIR